MIEIVNVYSATGCDFFYIIQISFKHLRIHLSHMQLSETCTDQSALNTLANQFIKQ